MDAPPPSCDMAQEEVADVVTISNVVITANFNCAIDLSELAWKMHGEYSPASFAAVQLRLPAPQTTALFFSTGKLGANKQDLFPRCVSDTRSSRHWRAVGVCSVLCHADSVSHDSQAAPRGAHDKRQHPEHRCFQRVSWFRGCGEDGAKISRERALHVRPLWRFAAFLCSHLASAPSCFPVCD
jgi:hypothetical protein